MTCEPWITDEDLAACNCPGDAPKEAVEWALQQSTNILYRLSGRRWPGICEATVVPCGCPNTDPGLPYPWRTGSGQWVNRVCGCAGSGSGCDGYQQTTLGTRMLIDVTSVTIGGTVVDPAAYTVHEGRYLVRTDGGVWPCCSRDWQVAFRYGRRPPIDGKRAAAEYATELVKACMPNQRCSLPQRVQTITRDGAPMTILDPFTFLQDGKLGLLNVDTWLMSVNPAQLQRRGTVWAPGMGGRVRRTG